MAGSTKRIKKSNKKVTKGVKKLWKKGQSASYNPKFNKYRQQAKKSAAFGHTGSSNLTVAKLAEHNGRQFTEHCDDDEMSIGGDTAFTGFTTCSLPTFSRLVSNWNVGSLLHKEMIAVLAAVTDVIKDKGGKETETEYFAALMTTLECVENSDEGVTAVICLLSMVIKKVNENVLKLHYDRFCDKFMELLQKYMNSDHVALLRNLLNIVYTLMKVKRSWSEDSCKKLKVLLEFTVHHKPKVRRTAHQIIHSLIVDCGPECGTVHPGTAVVTNFCNSKLESSGGPTASKDVFYILSILEETLAVFPKSSIKSLCETVLRVMTLSNSMVTSVCLRTLKGLFGMQPKEENLPADLNARIISALYDYQPNIKESQSLINWLELMEAALINLRKLDEKLCVAQLPKFYQTAGKCFQNNEVSEVVTFVLKNILHECIRPHSEVFQQYLLDDAVNNPMHKMFRCVEELLSYQYHNAWKYVLILLATFFEVMGKHCYTIMLKCLQSLADLHDSHKFLHISELEKTIGAAIQFIGPKVVLQAIPLQINVNSDKPDFSRSWLLPLLRDNIKKTELQFFIRYFMPLAAKLKNKARDLQEEQKVIESKIFNVMCSQIWSLLPGFCNEPTDLKQCLKHVAETLGKLLHEEPDHRMTVLSSLRMLVNKNLENEENRIELSMYCKNYLPILFNLYATEPKNKNEEKVHLAVYDTCKVFLQITDRKLCKQYFHRALEKLLSPEASRFLQQSMIDVCRAILPYVDTSEIEKIYEYCKPLLKDPNHTTQKKSYSLLNEICSSESKSCKLFVKEHLNDIRPLLCGIVSGLKPSTRALRLNILSHIITQLSEKEKDFLKSITPEAVLCTKENSVKARAAAYNLLIVIGNTMLKWQPGDQNGALSEYLKILLAGLAGSPHLMSATILAIGRVVYEFKDKIGSSLIHLLIDNTCLLLTSNSREVVVSAMSFLKILFSVMDTEDLAEHVEFMVKGITNISEDNQRHFRFKAKELFTRLIRKFGYEMISKLVPENYQKQITHIRKTEARKARGKKIDVDGSELQNENNSSDDSDEEMPLPTDTEKPTKISKKRKQNFETVIEEYEDDIIDLLDPSINKKLITKNPEKTVVKKKENGFAVSEDGRLIITEDDESAPKSKQEKQENERKEILNELGALFKNKKRKYKESLDGDDDENLGGSSVTKGIHRVDPKAKRRAPSVPGAEFKSKKSGGDCKKGKLQPYAYLPLNKQMLNKRNKMNSKKAWKMTLNRKKMGSKGNPKRSRR